MDVVLPCVQLASPLTARGFVRFYNVRPDRRQPVWICDECYVWIPAAKMRLHAGKCH